MKKDLRIIKTQKMLHNALLSLLEVKAFEEIKVSDICNEALINRSTFYAHYNDKYELLLDTINNLKSSFLENLNENEHDIDTREYYIELIKLLLNHIEEEKKVYQSMLLHNRNSIVMDILLDVARKDIEKRLENDKNIKTSVPIDILAKFYIGAFASIAMDWLKDSSKYTKQELINYINILIPTI